MHSKKQHGFTILEILISLSIFTILVMLTGSMFVISQQSYRKASVRAELTQNARVSLDRISREARQAVDIATVLPTTEVGAENELKFQDGHDISQITYIRYYLIGSDLMRQHLAYEFSSDPGVYVLWDSVDGIGDPPDEINLEERIVGEYFNSINFWGEDGLVNISIELSKNQNTINFNASIYSRNN